MACPATFVIPNQPIGSQPTLYPLISAIMNITNALSRIFTASECANLWECEVADQMLSELRWEAIRHGKPQAAIMLRRSAIRAKMAEFQTV